MRILAILLGLALLGLTGFAWALTLLAWLIDIGNTGAVSAILSKPVYEVLGWAVPYGAHLGAVTIGGAMLVRWGCGRRAPRRRYHRRSVA